MLVMEVMVPRQLDLSSIVGKVMLKSAWSASNPRGGPCAAVGFAWAGCPCHGRGLQALDCLATAGTMARCAGAIAHEPGGGLDERSD